MELKSLEVEKCTKGREESAYIILKEAHLAGHETFFNCGDVRSHCPNDIGSRRRNLQSVHFSDDNVIICSQLAAHFNSESSGTF